MVISIHIFCRYSFIGIVPRGTHSNLTEDTNNYGTYDNITEDINNYDRETV